MTEQRRMSLAEFVSMWDDDDPWAVPRNVWESRFAVRGMPDRAYLLTQPAMRMLDLETVLAIKPRRRTDTDALLPKRLARVVRTERIKQGKTLRALSRVSGVDVAVLSRFEAGRIDIRVAQLERIARGLRLFPALLFERARTQALPEDDEREARV